MVEQCANEILSRNNANRVVGNAWVYRFIKRLPSHLSLIKQKPMDKKRMEALDIGVIQAWFHQLQYTLKNHKIRPRNIYNFDETGFQLGQGKARKVVTASPYTADHIGNGGSGESATAIECIAADGWIMAPFFLMKGQFHMENWYQSTLPDYYRIAPTENGWITDSVAYDWLHFFQENTFL